MEDTQLNNAQTNLDVFAETLINLAEKDDELLIVTSDSRGSGRVTPFANKYPNQIVEIGIAEQNLVGISAGLSSLGKKVYSISPACFLTARALEQIKNDVAYSDHPVKIVGISSGVSYGSLGTTHHSLHDFAVFQAINNIDIVAPADNFETAEAVKAALNYPRPIYLRFGKKPMPAKLNADETFTIGKASLLTEEKENYDVAFFAIGEAVLPSLLAAKSLNGIGVNCSLLNLHTLRPLDGVAIIDTARKSKVIITVEEHSIHGGLGCKIASLLMENRIHKPLKIVGIPDEHTVTGSQAEIFNHYGISQQGLFQTAIRLLERKKVE